MGNSFAVLYISLNDNGRSPSSLGSLAILQIHLSAALRCLSWKSVAQYRRHGVKNNTCVLCVCIAECGFREFMSRLYLLNRTRVCLAAVLPKPSSKCMHIWGRQQLFSV